MATLPPAPVNEPPGSFAWQQWYLALSRLFGNQSGTIPWFLIDTSGSELSDIADRPHSDLQSVQGGVAGESYHLTSAQHTDLTDSGDSTIHFHATDRARANHTGTQALATISDVTASASEVNTLDGITSSTAELNILDGATVSAAELNILDGATLSTAELNILDGVTATAAELNVVDGITASTAELNFTDGVTSAIQTQLDAKVDTADVVFVHDFAGANFTAQLQAAVAAGHTRIRVKRGSYTLTAKITLATSMMIQGEGGFTTAITKGFNGDMFDMTASNCRLEGLWLLGDGVNFTGRGVVIETASSFQSINDCYMDDMNGYALEFEDENAGQHFTSNNTHYRRTTASNPAVKLPGGLGTFEDGGNRGFFNCRTLGGPLIDFADGSNTRLGGCAFAGLTFSSVNCSRITVVDSRWAQNSISIQGTDISITGNTIAATDITIPVGGSQRIIISGNGWSGLVPTFTDNSSNPDTNWIDARITASEAELNILDGATLSTAELNTLDGITSSTAELNILDGVTSTAAELNILDGATLTVTELNYVDGVTSAIQTQLDGKAATSHSHAPTDITGLTASAAELNILDGATLSTAELNILDGVTSTAAELNILDGATLNTTELNYVDGVTSNIQNQIDALTGGVAAAATKNYIINGDFLIWQRGTGFGGITNGSYHADRWYYVEISSATHTISRSTDVPTVAEADRLFSYSMLVECGAADAAIAAGDTVFIAQRIEGYNWKALAQRDMTLSFWVKASKTGTYCVSFANASADRSWVTEYVVNAANTWEYKSMTVDASPSAGGWNYENGNGLQVSFTLASGTDRHTTAGAWQTGNFNATSNQVNACDSTSNTFRLTGVQLEKGTVPTDFEQRTIQEELELCMRYYEKSYNYLDAPGTTTATGVRMIFAQDTTSFHDYGRHNYSVRKGTTPTVVFYNYFTGTSGEIRSISAAANGFSPSVHGSTAGEAGFNMNASGMTAGHLYAIHYTASAEL